MMSASTRFALTIIAGIVIALLAICGLLFGTIYGIAAITGNAFDGNLAEPGCDWTNDNCEPEDYLEMCFGDLAQDSPPSELERVRYCALDPEGTEG